MTQKNNPLHGVKLEQVVTDLVAHYGWEQMAEQININCFKSDPSVKSSLKFLRKTQWARDKVEMLWLKMNNHQLPDHYFVSKTDTEKPSSHTQKASAPAAKTDKTESSDSVNAHIWGNR
ncbi:DUF2132 domain-containing protein [Shewanella sp. WXL01]|uniref:VF530 family protein n=1 Tax=Shewanella sp. WXL01 TaxID=2709721 RepID=UPI00143841DE|nr:VF530 family protein [Shewanella sp. WXL01]NKF52426.1 DUF2132 domain-containing protein [Shewanella sp. WXL01]